MALVDLNIISVSCYFLLVLFLQPRCQLIVYREGDTVKQPMKKGSFVPKNVPGVGVGWWVMKGCGGVGWGGWVMKGWGGVVWGGVGWGGVGHEGVGWVCHIGVGWGGS